MFNNHYRSRSFALKQLHPHNRNMFLSVVFLGGIIGTFLLAYLAFGNDVDDNPSSLKLVVVLARHGERTPTKFYKNDPYQDITKYWPIGLGELTVRGKQDMYRLGETFRSRYKSFIKNYSVQSVRVDSSDTDRTLMSAEVLMAGWFPPQGDQVWNKELLWQPVPIHTRPREHDKILSLKAPCPKYSAEKAKVLKKIKENETVKDKEFYEYVSENTGEKVNSVHDAESLYSTLSIEELNGFKLPDWTKNVFPEPMRELTATSFSVFGWNKIIQRLHGGNLLNEILGHLKNKTEGKLKDKKLLVYSGHDITLVTLWRTLGFDERIVPYFSASFVWELHNYQNNEFFVKMFYMNNSMMTEPYELQIPKCSLPCPLDDLFKITEEVRPVDWDKECQID